MLDSTDTIDTTDITDTSDTTASVGSTGRVVCDLNGVKIDANTAGSCDDSGTAVA